MSLEMGFLLAILASMVYLFLSERLPVDLTALSGLMLLTLVGYLEPDEAFTGFASSAVITMLAIFIVGASLLETGIADRVGAKVHGWVGGREVPLVVTVMLAAAALSAFMNNIAAAAVMMPAAAGICRRAQLAPSRLFMPLAFGAVLGGMTTSVGTPANILATEMLRERGFTPFALFDFTPIGVACVLVGTLYMATLGRRLLPDRGLLQQEEQRDLEELYKLRERTFALRIPQGSPLDGETLGDSELGSALGVQVVALRRSGHRRLAPAADTVLRSGDELLVLGRRENVEELLRVQGLPIESMSGQNLPRPSGNVTAARLRLCAESPLVGHSLRESRFRQRFGAVVVAIERDGQLVRSRLGDRPLHADDRLYVIGERQRFEAMKQLSDFEVRAEGSQSVERLREQFFVLTIDETSPLAGRTLIENRIGELAGMTVGAVLRDGETILALDPEEKLRVGDRLVVAGEPWRIQSLLELGDIQVDPDADRAVLESARVKMVEATVAPRSSVAGKTLRQLEFRDRYGLQVLAVWRGGERLDGDLAELALRFGDAFLLQGPRERAEKLAADPDFLVLSSLTQEPRRSHKAPWAIAALVTMIAMVVTGWQPIHVAAFTAAVGVILSGALRMEEAYRAIEWRAIFLVAALLPIGLAMERSGLAGLLGQAVAAAGSEPFGAYGVLAAVVILASLLSQALDGAPAVVLIAPVALGAAEHLGINPHALMMGAGLAPSVAFMTPFSQKTNLLVMGAGGYRAKDFLKVGTPLTLIILVLLVVLVPIFFPLRVG